MQLHNTQHHLEQACGVETLDDRRRRRRRRCDMCSSFPSYPAAPVMPSGKRAPEGESNHRRRNLMTIRGASLQRSKLISRAPGWRIRPLYMWPVTTTSRECGPTANCVHITAAMRSAYVKGKQVNIISGFRRGRVVGPAVDVFLPPRKRREPTPPLLHTAPQICQGASDGPSAMACLDTLRAKCTPIKRVFASLPIIDVSPSSMVVGSARLAVAADWRA